MRAAAARCGGPRGVRGLGWWDWLPATSTIGATSSMIMVDDPTMMRATGPEDPKRSPSRMAVQCFRVGEGCPLP